MVVLAAVRPRRLLAALSAAIAVSYPLEASTAEPPARHVTILIRWAEPVDAKTLTDSINRLRIDADASVSIRVTHFNFLHYTLKITVEERTVESYALLDRMWSQIFAGVGGLPFERTGPPAEDFDALIFAWRRALAEADTALTDTLRQHAGKIALTDDERAAIVRSKTPVGVDSLSRIEDRRRKALAQADTTSKLDLYESTLARHDEVVKRLQSFVAAADLVDKGQEHVIGRKKAGTVVTFTIAPVNSQQAQAGTPFQGSYFVRSRHPLMLHVGFAGSSLDDLEFEQVRSASGADLFLATQSDSTTQGLVTFLSYELRNFGPSAEVGFQATLGTSFQHPGDAFYIGGGVRVTRFVLSTGTYSQSVSEGENKVGETIAGLVGQRELYTSIAKHRDWAWFAAISIRVY